MITKIMFAEKKTALTGMFSVVLLAAGLSPVFAQDLSIGGAITIVGQGISDEAFATNTEDDEGNDLDPEGKANGAGIVYSADIELEKEFFTGTAFLYLIAAEGDAVFEGANSKAEGGDFQDQLMGVAEAWYTHTFFDQIVHVTLGKIDPTGIYDGNEVANDGASQFLADVFTNNAAILFPGYTPGANVSLELGDIVTFSLGMFEDEDATVPGEFQETFFIGELGFHYYLFDDPGNFRMTLWNSGAHERSGFAFNMDQAFAGEFFSIFSRLGFVSDTDETEPETELAFSFGGQFVVAEAHHIGFAYGVDSPAGDDFDPTSWLEAYVDFEIDDGVNLAFDIQTVLNPDYDQENDALVVYGFRTVAEF